MKFYDSDPKKKGLTMAGKTIGQFDREDMLQGKVELILISSHGSEKAIYRFICSQNVDVEVIRLYS